MSARDIPVLFSAPMVRANRDESDTKTMTRRIVKAPTGYILPSGDVWNKPISGPHTVERRPGWNGDPTACITYASPGDQLWVREAWRTHKDLDLVAPSDLKTGERIKYEADGATSAGRHGEDATPWGKLRPAMFMCRWMSRDTLLVNDQRIERLQAISEANAYEEGAQHWAAEVVRDGNKFPSVVRAYQALWESINGADSWKANPWVWVISYERITA